MYSFILQNWWILFGTCFLLFLLTALWMQQVAAQFYIASQNLRFSIFDLEFPISEYALDTFINGMGSKERKVLRKHLWIDFLFMPAAYIGIALLCLKTADKMIFIGQYVFWGLAIFQVFPWIFDVLENTYLLRKLRNMAPVQSNPEVNSPAYCRYQWIVRVKFAIALTGTVCSLFGLLYFWIMGAYQKQTLLYLLGIILLIALFTFVGKLLKTKPAFAEE